MVPAKVEQRLVGLKVTIVHACKIEVLYFAILSIWGVDLAREKKTKWSLHIICRYIDRKWCFGKIMGILDNILAAPAIF